MIIKKKRKEPVAEEVKQQQREEVVISPEQDGASEHAQDVSVAENSTPQKQEEETHPNITVKIAKESGSLKITIPSRDKSQVIHSPEINAPESSSEPSEDDIRDEILQFLQHEN